MTNVLKIGGALLDDAAALDALADALAAAGGNWVLVHGGGPQLDKALAQLGEVTVKVAGLRVTSPAAAAIVREEMDLLGAQLAAALHRRGLATRHVPAAHRTLHGMVKEVPEGSLGRVGTVQGVGVELLEQVMDAGLVPIVTPVAWDVDGPLNINADEAAASVAACLGAQRLILATSVPAVLDAKGRSISSLTVAQADALVGGPAKDGMIPKIRAATEAIVRGVSEVVIGSPTAQTLRGDAGTVVRATPRPSARSNAMRRRVSA